MLMGNIFGNAVEVRYGRLGCALFRLFCLGLLRDVLVNASEPT